jgi:hypothetical protein
MDLNCGVSGKGSFTGDHRGISGCFLRIMRDQETLNQQFEQLQMNYSKCEIKGDTY